MEAKCKDKKGVIFGLDDVLYPEKDYLLQVYYLFSEFINYAEHMDAKPILSFMQNEFEISGTDRLFEKTSKNFDIPSKYEENFTRLHQNARLPLKLLLFSKVLHLMQELVVNRQAIFLLIDGDPIQQINKIKQLEWHGLEGYLKLYFTAEFEAKPSRLVIDYLLEANSLRPDEVLLVGSATSDEEYASLVGIDYVNLSRIL